MHLIDGKSVAAAVLAECQLEIAKLQQQGIQPGLAVVIVGDDPASHVYVASKVKTCAELGMHSEKSNCPPAPAKRNC